MADSGNVVDLTALRRRAQAPGGDVPGGGDAHRAVPGARAEDGRADPDGAALSFPPVELAPDAELAAAVAEVPLVRDVRRLAGWAEARGIPPDDRLPEHAAARAAAELGLPADRARLAWHAMVRAAPLAGPGASADPLRLWDAVAAAVLERAATGLTGSPVVDGHLTEMLAAMYARGEPITLAALAEGVAQAHEVGCAARPDEMAELRAELPARLRHTAELLAYCGLGERRGEEVRLTPLGLWAVRRDLIRAGHQAPLLSEVAPFAELSAAELVEAMLSGRAPAGAALLWVGRRPAQEAARELVAVAASGTAGQRGVVGTILEELGPEAAPAMREALAEPMMRRQAAVWLDARDLDAPVLSAADGVWLAVDALAGLLHVADAARAMAEFGALGIGEDLLRLIDEMRHGDHPDTLAVLDLIGAHHPDARVARAARKAAMKVRSR